MTVRYFAEDDTLYFELRLGRFPYRRDLNENTLMEFDATGNLCDMTVEHADRAALPQFTFEHEAA